MQHPSRSAGRENRFANLLFPLLLGFALISQPACAQVETVESPAPQVVWSSLGTAEGHLALAYSPAGGFSPESSELAIVNGGEVALMKLNGEGIAQVLHPGVKGITNLAI